MPVEIHVDLAPVSMRAYTFPGLAPFTIPTSRLGWLTSDWPGVTLARLAKGLIGAITDSMMVFGRQIQFYVQFYSGGLSVCF